MQTLRNIADRIVGFAGLLVILVTVLFSVTSVWAALAILVGILLMQAGIWHLAARVVPSGRTATILRAEVEHFISIVRELYHQARAGQWQTFVVTEERLKEQVPVIIEAISTDLENEHNDA